MSDATTRCRYRWQLGEERCGRPEGHDGGHQTMWSITNANILRDLHTEVASLRQRVERAERLAEEWCREGAAEDARGIYAAAVILRCGKDLRAALREGTP